MKSIHERLLQTECNLLTLLAEEEPAIQSFHDAWSTLCYDIDIATDLDHDTLSLAHGVSSRIAILIPAFLELYAASSSLKSSMMDDVELILSELTLEDSTWPEFGSCPSSREHSPVTLTGDVGVHCYAAPPAVGRLMSFPSPPRASRQPSLVWSSLSEEGSEDEELWEPIVGRKRSASHLRGDAEPNTYLHEEQLAKRSRSAIAFGDSAVSMDPPTSPQSEYSVSIPLDIACSSDMLHLPSLTKQTVPLYEASFWTASPFVSERSEQITVMPMEHKSCRKRRLSDEDLRPSPKRSRSSPIESQFQTVSDPLPVSISVQPFERAIWNDWSFEMPSPVTTAPPDPSVPLEISLFDGWDSFNSALSVSDSESQESASSSTVCIDASVTHDSLKHFMKCMHASEDSVETASSPNHSSRALSLAITSPPSPCTGFPSNSTSAVSDSTPLTDASSSAIPRMFVTPLGSDNSLSEVPSYTGSDRDPNLPRMTSISPPPVYSRLVPYPQLLDLSCLIEETSEMAAMHPCPPYRHSTAIIPSQEPLFTAFEEASDQTTSSMFDGVNLILKEWSVLDDEKEGLRLLEAEVGIISP